ncbi:MAG TPA: hypothetical protein VJW20_24745 [Candidatus Angelobacter sp.]|nr:hypothetical protein [Candidatus Angelobacter sp.]
MRRLYILPKEVWSGTAQTGTRTNPDGSTQPVLLPMIQLFHPMLGSHYIDLPNGMVLMMTSFDHNERSEDIFHAHPQVAILPHPTRDGNKPLKNHIGSSGYKFEQHHLDALTGHPDLGILPTDSVLDVARKASAIHPEVRFRNAL